jgi:hypothetical protein
MQRVAKGFRKFNDARMPVNVSRTPTHQRDESFKSSYAPCKPPGNANLRGGGGDQRRLVGGRAPDWHPLKSRKNQAPPHPRASIENKLTLLTIAAFLSVPSR